MLDHGKDVIQLTVSNLQLLRYVEARSSCILISFII